MNMLRRIQGLVLLGVLAFNTASAFAVQTEQAFMTVIRYNLNGQVTGIISPRPSPGAAFPAVRNTYNTRGLLQRVEEGVLSSFQNETVKPSTWNGFTVIKRTNYTYDDLGQKLSEQAVALSAAATSTLAGSAPAQARVTEYSYDDYGRVDCVAKRLNGTILGDACSLGSDIGYGLDRITHYEYTSDNFGLIEKEYRAYNTALEQVYVTNTYDAAGRLTDQLDANNNRTHLEYNAQNRLETMYFPDKTYKNTYSLSDKEVYSYDDNGNRTSVLKRDDVTTIDYQYDALNREVKKTIRPGSSSQDVYTRYDLLNLKTSARFGSHSGAGVSYSYNGFGELTQEGSNATGISYSVSNLYDKHGNRTRVTYNDGRIFTYTYDNLNRQQDIIEGTSGSTVLIHTDYDVYSRVSGQITAGNVSTQIGYDRLSRSYNVTQSLSGMGALNQTYTFEYNPIGQIDTESFTNDLYVYEESGSKVGNYTVNNLNQYTGVASQAFGYDKSGNLICDGGFVASTNACSATKFSYDAENRLISATGDHNATLQYDPAGRLVRITSGGQITHFQYNGDQLIAEYRNGVMQHRYVFGQGVDKPVVSYTGAGVSASSRLFLHSNHQGSIILATNSSGQGVYLNTYDAYGVPGKANQGRFAYTGQAYLPAVGLYYYKARMYYPQLGRFLQTDPIGYEDQMNLYAYVGNDPLNMTDPTGERSEVLGILALACSVSPDCKKAVGKAGAAVVGVIAGVFIAETTSESSPEIDPKEVAGKTPEEIDKVANDKGLEAKGPDPQSGKGAYVDPVTGKQRILVHPDADCGPHCHVNDAEGNRLDENGNVVPPESPEAHLPLKR